MTSTPMFLKFINREIEITELLHSFIRSGDANTVKAATKALENPQDLEEFRKELEEAVNDLVLEGVGEEFKAFVNHYMQESIEEDVTVKSTRLGENRSQIAKVKDENAPWIQGFICYNLCLYIKAYGLDDLKKCRVCGKLFCHKGKYAVYCSDLCKSKKAKKPGVGE